LAHSSAAFDVNATLGRVQNDLAFLREIIELFAGESETLLNEVRQSIQSSDAVMLERSAHTLKGAVANFGAKPAFDAAFRLESMGQQSKFARAPEACTELEKEIARLNQALAQYSREHNPAS
jgi:HPt (histidine-containing phosphotransfer) domain-containing protein